jgi:hypothetical protein
MSYYYLHVWSIDLDQADDASRWIKNQIWENGLMISCDIKACATKITW